MKDCFRKKVAGQLVAIRHVHQTEKDLLLSILAWHSQIIVKSKKDLRASHVNQ
jgi:hypothetical protein